MNPTEPPTVPARAADGESQRHTNGDHSLLRAKARAALHAGKLPQRSPDHTWGGPGAGACCSVCGAIVKPEETELELEFARSGDGSQPERHHLHSGCLAAWEAVLKDVDLRAFTGRTAMARCLPVHRNRRSNENRHDPGADTLGELLDADQANPHPSEKEWVRLVQGIAAGDQRALEALYERTHRIVYTLSVRITGNRETAEEVTLDVFHDVWRRASRTTLPADRWWAGS